MDKDIFNGSGCKDLTAYEVIEEDGVSYVIECTDHSIKTAGILIKWS